MKLVIESTPIVTVMNRNLVRVWTGMSEKGVLCTVYIAGITVDLADDTSEFDAELAQKSPPMELGATLGLRRNN